MNIDEPCSVHYTTSITLTAGGICMASALLSLSRLPTSSNDLAAAGRKDFPPGKLNSPRYGSGIFKTSFPRTAASLSLPVSPLSRKVEPVTLRIGFSARRRRGGKGTACSADFLLIPKPLSFPLLTWENERTATSSPFALLLCCFRQTIPPPPPFP